MKIGVDARMIRHSGIGSYVQGLLRGLVEIETPHRFVAFVPRGGAALLPDSPRLEVRRADVPIYGWREQAALPALLRSARCDVLHVPHYNVPFLVPGPLVVTVHDLIHLIHPEFLGGRLRAAWAAALVRHAVRRARAVIAVSHTTQRDLLRRTRVAPERVHVVTEGIAPHFAPRPPGEIAGFRERLGLADPYVLYVGLLRPHKNLVRLVRAFASCKRALGATRLRLVLRGRRDPRYPEIEGEVRAMGLEADVRFLDDPVPPSDMPLLYAAAEVFVFPSLYEGFGLPPLEAMACAVPVLAADAGSLPEVLGSAALFAPPRDEAAMAAALERLLRDASLRDELRRRGLAHARGFDWRTAARDTVRVYEAAAAT